MDCRGDAHERDTGNTAQERKIWSYIIFGPSVFLGISVGPLMPVLVSPRHHQSSKITESFQSTPVCPHNTNLWALEPIGPGEVVSPGTGLVIEAVRSV